jgi:hypothetical protein
MMLASAPFIEGIDVTWVENVDFLEIIPQVFAFVGSQDAQGEADQGPQVNHRVIAAVVLAEFVDLGVAVVAGRRYSNRPRWL